MMHCLRLACTKKLIGLRETRWLTLKVRTSIIDMLATEAKNLFVEVCVFYASAAYAM